MSGHANIRTVMRSCFRTALRFQIQPAFPTPRAPAARLSDRMAVRLSDRQAVHSLGGPLALWGAFRATSANHGAGAGRGEGDSTPRRADWFKQIHLLLHQEQRNLVTDRQTPASPAPTHTPPRGPHSSACVSHGFPRRRSIWSWATLPPFTRKVCRADLPSEREALDP